MTQENEPIQTLEPPLVVKKTGGVKVSVVVAILALLVALATAGGGWYVWQRLQSNQQQDDEQIVQLQKNLSQAETLLHQQNRTLQTAQRDLQGLIQQSRQKEDRVLIEANYLANLAAFHLTFENNTLLAQRLLTAADQRLASDQSPVLWPVRQALAQDIAMLDATPSVDLPGLVARLGALSEEAEQLPELPVTVLHQEQSATTSSPSPTTQQTKTHAVLDKFKHFAVAIGHALSNMVTVSKDNKLAPALLTHDQRLYVVTNIQSQLTLAQWAAVHRQETVYQQSLAKVADWLQRYFPSDAPLVQSMFKTVTNLKTVAVNPATPSISRSLDALQKMKS